LTNIADVPHRSQEEATGIEPAPDVKGIELGHLTSMFKSTWLLQAEVLVE
jgi:hypothetical protein